MGVCVVIVTKNRVRNHVKLLMKLVSKRSVIPQLSPNVGIHQLLIMGFVGEVVVHVKIPQNYGISSCISKFFPTCVIFHCSHDSTPHFTSRIIYHVCFNDVMRNRLVELYANKDYNLCI